MTLSGFYHWKIPFFLFMVMISNSLPMNKYLSFFFTGNNFWRTVIYIGYLHSLIKNQTLPYFYLGKSQMEISKDRQHYLASLILCSADAGHNNKEKKSLSLLQPRCYKAVELGFNRPRRINWLLEGPCFWLCGDQGKPFQHA